MTKIIIRMNNEGGELDSRSLHVDDPENEGCAALVAETLVAMINECGLIHPGDSFTVERG